MPCMAVCSRLKKCAACSGKGELDNSVQAHLARAHCDKAVDNPVPRPQTLHSVSCST